MWSLINFNNCCVGSTRRGSRPHTQNTAECFTRTPDFRVGCCFLQPDLYLSLPHLLYSKDIYPVLFSDEKKSTDCLFSPRLSKETNVLSTIVGFYTVQTIFCVVGVLQGSFCHSAHLSLCPLSPPSMNYVGGDTNERKKRAQNRIERQTDRDMG